MLLYDVGIGGGCKGAFLNRQVFTWYVKMHLFENDEGIGWIQLYVGIYFR